MTRLLITVLSLLPLALPYFKAHFLLGADWKLCCRQLNMNGGTFLHEVYRIQQ